MADAVNAGDWRLREFAMIELVTHIIALNAISGDLRHFETVEPYWFNRHARATAFRQQSGKALIVAHDLNSIIADANSNKRRVER